MVNYKNFLKTITIIFLSFFIGILFCELILRVKHHYIVNYDIEMWKYAKKLKLKLKTKKLIMYMLKINQLFCKKPK